MQLVHRDSCAAVRPGRGLGKNFQVKCLSQRKAGAPARKKAVAGCRDRLHAMGQSIISPCSALCRGSGAGKLHRPNKMLRRGVLREAECLSHSALTLAEGLVMIAPDLIVQTTIYLPSVCTELLFKLNRHMLFVTVTVSAKLQALYFQHFFLLSKNCCEETGRSYLHCLAWIFLVTLQPFIFREFYLRVM